MPHNKRTYLTPSADKLDNIGIDSIAAQIQSGDTFGEIADKAGVGLTTLHNWLDNHHADASARARQESAEAWLDKGLAALEAAKYKDGNLCPNAAKAIAQECARRAGIRNQKYRDKATIEHEVQISPLGDYLARIAQQGSTLSIRSGVTIEHDDDTI